MVELGATSVDELTTVFNHGDVMKKENAKPFMDMLVRHSQEVKDSLLDEAFAEEAFLYEMDNHEYAINWDGDDDVLSCFSIKYDELVELGLKSAYMRARTRHMKKAQEWM